MIMIEFKNVTKYFKIYKNKSNSIKESFVNKILNRNKMEVNRFPVINDTSFKIYSGETIGIIGENGTGKSTTLKLISKILYPNSGEVHVHGSIASLLEIGIGFQPDLTGRENVFLYGSILGLKKHEIEAKYDDIVNFAEIEEFMDSAVKNYSSGMYMRLAFSVATSVDPDILLVDEVLSVGDASFQKKCIDRIMDFKNRGKTIVFVSHDMGSVRKICSRVFFIKRGGIFTEGSPEKMIGLYLKLVKDKYLGINSSLDEENAVLDVDFNVHRAMEYAHLQEGNKKLEITKVYFSDLSGKIINIFDSGEDFKINIEFKKNEEVESAIVGFEIITPDDYLLIYKSSNQDAVELVDIKEINFISILVKDLRLVSSNYYLSPFLINEDHDNKEIFDFRRKNYIFNIKENNIREYGKIRVQCDWDF
ncbi:MAG: ABC transporter ATP-binding protein [Oscillospiraceae bacterium]|nr:ABC transporter ATP-binding protein [Oscillospiraceae bacterium]